MNILLVGSGAREHAIAKALKRSPKKPNIHCVATSHNPGILSYTQHYWVGDICDVPTIIHHALQWKCDLAIIGPEAPLHKGLADALWQHAIPTVGPTQKLAQLETSKAFARNLLKKYRIPGSVLYQVFHDLSNVTEFLQELGHPNYVIKADGLMGGKGVKVAGDHLQTFEEAYQFCKEIHSIGQSFVIEEKLIGQEFSLLCFSDGNTLVPMPAVQDHKRALEQDKGPNTGGMGSYSDANHRLPFLTEKDVQTAIQINQSVMHALSQETGEKYIGILYGSFMATQDGIRLIEYNARFGDPEAMNILTLLDSDFVAICEALTKGDLSPDIVRFKALATVCKYAVPEGYPDHPLKNFEIDISHIQNPDQLYFAAVDQRDNILIATGSRTAAVVGIAETIDEAEKIAEEEIQRIKGPLFHRKDIGTKALIYRRIKQMQELRSCIA